MDKMFCTGVMVVNMLLNIVTQQVGPRLVVDSVLQSQYRETAPRFM